jgi:hypothetical protein
MCSQNRQDCGDGQAILFKAYRERVRPKDAEGFLNSTAGPSPHRSSFRLWVPEVHPPDAGDTKLLRMWRGNWLPVSCNTASQKTDTNGQLKQNAHSPKSESEVMNGGIGLSRKDDTVPNERPRNECYALRIARSSHTFNLPRQRPLIHRLLLPEFRELEGRQDQED